MAQRFPLEAVLRNGSRVRIRPFTERDTEALALVKLGSGNNVPGYYMYQGGQNPEGRLTTLNESKASGYRNDLPVKDYDFTAPLGSFGQVRERYHRLRLQHLFLHDFGETIPALVIEESAEPYKKSKGAILTREAPCSL